MVKVSSLIGKKVITTDAFTVGEVSGVEMDINQWKITHLDVGLAKEATSELGFKKPFMGHITILVPVELIRGLGDVVTLKRTREELKGLPEWKPS
jgi:sporulation protein YlmC with PRC-barrel domain